ncbi:hypothetical protein PC110_g15191 [Phytophthora cactorum]|uniref:Uncharacterized protein n=1 Tax=Phytophthora cactorum TaxID=29920 RepID=A0A329RZ07_9STRA|nr:hypothetical protein PC110_g15191 [Phytophthora cactorum]
MPGCRVKGGKQGVNFFKGEDELLVRTREYVLVIESQTPYQRLICLRLLVSFSSEYLGGNAATATDFSSSNLGEFCAPQECQTAGCLCKDQPPRQRTKKQLAADANKRRRELAAFGEIWGHQNGSEADGTMVEPPATSSPDQVLYEDIEKLECCQTDISYADKKCFIDAANAERVAGVVANADMDVLATEADADISANGDETGFTAEANAGMAQQETEPIADTAAGDAVSRANTALANIPNDGTCDGEPGSAMDDERLPRI